ncbi:MAG: molybdenum cofactor guanylyltransferase MobA, partial [Alphaproteobacteria bacterium]
HPVVGLWHLSLLGSLRRALVEEGVRKVDVWTAGHGIVDVAYDAKPVDPFFNANKPEDLEMAGKLLAHLRF